MGIVEKQPVHQPKSGSWISLRCVVVISGIGFGVYLIYRLLKGRKQRRLYVEKYEPGES